MVVSALNSTARGGWAFAKRPERLPSVSVLLRKVFFERLEIVPEGQLLREYVGRVRRNREMGGGIVQPNGGT